MRSKIFAIQLRRGARHSSTHNPCNLQPEPFRQFFDAHGEPMKLKGVTPTIRPGTQMLPPTYRFGLNGWTSNALPQ
jgi:hypothetical protein